MLPLAKLASLAPNK